MSQAGRERPVGAISWPASRRERADAPRAVGAQRLERGAQIGEGAVVEAGPDAAGIDQPRGRAPAFRVLSDRTLHAIAAARPLTDAQLLEVPGIGLKLAQKYGKQIFRVVSAGGS